MPCYSGFIVNLNVPTLRVSYSVEIMVKGLCLDSLKRVNDLSLHLSHAAFPVPLYVCPRIFVLMVAHL